jgi:acyl-CoA thioesterase-1
MARLFNARWRRFRRAILSGGAAMVLLTGLPVSLAAQDAPVILALGDSLTAGYGLAENDILPVRLEAALAEAGTPATVINAGVSGDTTAGGLARLDWLMAERAPDVLMVGLGGNDGLRAIDPAATRANIEAIIRRGQEVGAVVLLTGMFAPPNLGREYETEFNAVFPELATMYDTVFYPFLLEGVAAVPALNQPDGIHPNRSGVDRIVEGLLPAVQAALTRARDSGS